MRNQNDLHEVEDRCTEEQPPACSAGCPLGIDVRAFVLAMKEKSFSKAWKLLERGMPLPGVTARLCEAPCENFCLRGELGDAIAISALEKVCLREAEHSTPIRPLPARGKKVRCIGGEASSLACAWDLAKKGYSVEIVASEGGTGAALRACLPEGALEKELAKMEGMNVQFRTVTSLTTEELATDEIDALYLGQDDFTSGLPADLACDEFTRQCNTPKIFTGGASTQTPFITGLSDGRQAALSIDRFLQNASLTTGRLPLRHGKTTLSPETEGIKHLPRIAAAGDSYTAEEAAAEAARCIDCHCLRCVRACVYLQEYGDFPRKHARAIFNNFSIYQGVHGAYSLIDSCSLCRQCEEICPTDFSMADICLDARERLVEAGDIPPNAHYFALQEMHHAQEETNLLRHAPGHSASKVLFYPGCQLAAMRPQQVWTLYNYLRGIEEETGIWLDCCGAPAHWAGRKAETEEINARFRERWLEMGSPKIVTACSSCLEHFREAGGLEVDSVWNLLVKFPPEGIHAADVPLALSDPCTARWDEETKGSVRTLLQDCGQQLAPLAASGKTTECCGFGGLMENANPKLAQKVIEARVAQSEQPFLTWCAMCRDRLAKTGKPVYHILDLLFPSQAIDPAEPPATISERRYNRKLLQKKLLVELYGEKEPIDKPWNSIDIDMEEDVQWLLDSRHILEDDIRRTLAAREESGAFFVNSDGRERASAKIGDVTFWVEYRREGKTYHILRAWSHRMNLVKEGDQ
jgi:Fe-S oxidoreductase